MRWKTWIVRASVVVMAVGATSVFYGYWLYWQAIQDPMQIVCMSVSDCPPGMTTAQATEPWVTIGSIILAIGFAPVGHLIIREIEEGR